VLLAAALSIYNSQPIFLSATVQPLLCQQLASTHLWQVLVQHLLALLHKHRLRADGLQAGQAGQATQLPYE
jgi:hypothetical protein